MAVASVNIMRVSNNLQTTSLLESLRRNTLSLFNQQNRVSSGSNFTAPSDDPVGASRAVELTEILERQEQVLTNIRHADSFLSVTDSGIGEVSDVLTDAYGIASEMVNSTADQSQRQSMSELVRGMIDQLVSVGNRTYEGVHLFGGQQTTSTPFTQKTGGVEYRGDVSDLTAHVDYRQNPAINLNGADLFGMLSSKVAGNVDLDPAVNAATRLADVAGAAKASVTQGQIRVTAGSPATTFLVDLSHADTVGDVVDAINASAAAAGLTVGAGADFNAEISPAANGIDINVTAGTVTVAEVGNGATARDLGLFATDAPGVSGSDLNALVTTTTPVDSLFGGQGAILSSILVQNGSMSATVDLSDAVTVGDILNKINGCGLDVEAAINSAKTGIDIVNRVSGLRMSIGETGGDTATVLGIRSLQGGTTLSSLNDGDGVQTKPGKADFKITTSAGSVLEVSIDGATTVDDVIGAINAAAQTAGVNVMASLASTGNGIRIVDGTAGSGTLRVDRMNNSTAADDLGILKTDTAATGEIVGDDVGSVRTDSVFTALYDLFDALTTNSPTHIQEQQITKAGEAIRAFIDRSAQLRGTVGARSKAMSTRLRMTEDAVSSSRALLSEVKDLDYTEAITKFQQAQTALQANLQTGPRMLQMSLMNFLG